ncbi:hypothetical protein MUO14_03525 [Halobacillus shinanisalinarum]|uniref:DUF8208 domain-containing protein n=1 Tax=Halobacillus shinanisalinarum TaxID=2932258 RepID=A0ABY4H361_9BACI|nr:hypothetical protein [Halobacillus shinanisalinarum]UOQ94052.1 hypothetical protein MUO14_03525 [Halobacillus shinanisalinarum]
MSDEELLEKLLQFSEVLHTNNIFSSGLRIMGWGIILFLKMIVDSLEGMVDSVLTLTNFFRSEPVKSFLETIQPVLYILLAFSLAIIGLRLIFNKEKNRAEIPMNIFISIMTISLLTFGMGKVDEFTGDAIDVAQVDTESFTTSDRVMMKYITDIAVYDETGWETSDIEKRHHVSPDNIDKISINETITREFEKANGEQLSSEGKEILMNKVGLESNGEEGLVELGKSSLFDFLPEHYYRWDVEWFTAIVTLGVMAFTMVLISIKVAKLCFELGFNHIVALIMAYADISTGQRLKAIIKNIGSIFASLIMIFLSLRVYMYYTTFIGDHLDGIAYLIALVAGSLAVIDGPNIVQKLFGIDAGLKNAWHVAMGGYLASKTIGPPAKKAVGAVASGGTSAVMHSGAGAAGALAGMAGGKGKGSSQNVESPSPTQGTPGKDFGEKLDQKSGIIQSDKGSEQHSQPALQKSKRGQQLGEASSIPRNQEQQSDHVSGVSTPSIHEEMRDEERKQQSPNDSRTPRLHEEMKQGNRQVAASIESKEPVDQRSSVMPFVEQGQKSQQAIHGDQSKAPTSTDDIPMPNQHRTEQRTMGQYMKDRVKDRFNNNHKVQGAKRTYNLSRNTTENWKHKIQKRERGS